MSRHKCCATMSATRSAPTNTAYMVLRIRPTKNAPRVSSRATRAGISEQMTRRGQSKGAQRVARVEKRGRAALCTRAGYPVHILLPRKPGILITTVVTCIPLHGITFHQCITARKSTARMCGDILYWFKKSQKMRWTQKHEKISRAGSLQRGNMDKSNEW
jgi:hypothetical protein